MILDAFRRQSSPFYSIDDYISVQHSTLNLSTSWLNLSNQTQDYNAIPIPSMDDGVDMSNKLFNLKITLK